MTGAWDGHEYGTGQGPGRVKRVWEGAGAWQGARACEGQGPLGRSLGVGRDSSAGAWDETVVAYGVKEPGRGQ